MTVTKKGDKINGIFNYFKKVLFSWFSITFFLVKKIAFVFHFTNEPITLITLKPRIFVIEVTNTKDKMIYPLKLWNVYEMIIRD